MRKHLAFLFFDRPVLSLAFLCLFVFAARSLWQTTGDAAVGSESSDGRTRFYVELVEPDGFPVVFEFRNMSELKNRLPGYELSGDLKNGDRLILNDDGKFTLSKIDGKKSLALGISIGINSAGVDDLIVLPGIGKVLAERIVEYRNSDGGYDSVDELIAVKGIGEKKLSAVRRFISAD